MVELSQRKLAKLGLLGGLTWHSSVEYERLLNLGVQAELGGNASADLLVRSYNFADIAAAHKRDAWDELTTQFISDAHWLEAGGAKAVLICANTMHRIAPAVAAAISVPLIDMLTITAQAVRATGISTVGFLGTGTTMRQGFYQERFAAEGITALAPEEPDLTLIDNLIYRDLSAGKVTPEAPTIVQEVVARLKRRGAQGIIAACTEIPLAFRAEHTELPYFNSLELHAKAALEFILGEN